MRFLGITAALTLGPAAAMAEGTLPQMDFHNPLTGYQVLWMVVILVVLYFTLSRWGLPEMGKVLENRAAVIGRDLAAARAAKTEADQAVKALKATMMHARNSAQAEIATALEKAKAAAAQAAAAATAKMDARLAESEAQIDQARHTAMAAIKPVAEATATEILRRLTGVAPGADILAPRVDDALAARKAA